MEPLVRIHNLTKDYGCGRGIFNASFSINQGECYGFLGPNGAGKTTAIRHLMGFSKPDAGTAEMFGCNVWGNNAAILNQVGYLPGEIALPNDMTAASFLDYQGKLRRTSGTDRRDELMRLFQFNPSMKIRSMSLGERRKLAIVAAFMHDPEVLILDEPTSGLDPIMQDVFINFIIREKQRGKTILLSSHIFNEVAATCDRISIIKQGRIVEEFNAEDIGSNLDASRQGSLLAAILKNPTHGEPTASNVNDDALVSMRDLTKDYGRGRGVFNVNLDIKQGEVLGLVGTNGSGKTTTIRALMGFIKPTSGEVLIQGKEAWSCAPELMGEISYIPGEMQFPRFSSANSFFDYQAKLLGLKSSKRRQQLIDALRLDATVNPHKMSKGMKQKTAIVAALMAENSILIMDEPTTGLDPVMRDVFIDLVKQEKEAGRTILMSSHILEEIEEVCDRIAVIQNGRIADVLTIEELQAYRNAQQDAQRIQLEERFKLIFKKEN